MPYEQAFDNTLYGGAMDAEIDIHDSWVSDDGSQGGFMWVWRGQNTQGNPFELLGLSLVDFDENGKVAYELVTYPYADDYVRDAVMGGGDGVTATV